MATIFVAEVIDDGPAFGTDIEGRIAGALSSLSSLGGSGPAVGTIEWRTGADAAFGSVSGFAAPLFPWVNQVPLCGEYVLCIGAPSTSNTEATAAESFFYIGPIQIDGKRNRNISGGIFKRGTSAIPSIPKPIPPTMPIKPMPALAPLPGDTIFQDRHGSTIRMSATPLAAATRYISNDKAAQFSWKKPGISPNPVSPPLVTPGCAGNPIMVLSVGNLGQQTKTITGAAKGLGAPASLVENIETDLSTIYLTSTQGIDYTMPFPNGRKNLSPLLNNPLNGFQTDVSGHGRTKNPNDTVPPANEEKNKAGTISKNTVFENNPSAGNDFLIPSGYPLPSVTNLKDQPNSQILIRSHRVVMTARLDNVIIGAKKDIKLGTRNWRMELDSSLELINELFNQVIVLTMHCQELTDIVHEHITITQNMQFPTGVGPTGPTLKAYFEQLENIRKQVGSFKATGDDIKNTTYTRFVERGENITKLFKEFGIQKRTEKEKTLLSRS
jgi:hypothetical protein